MMLHRHFADKAETPEVREPVKAPEVKPEEPVEEEAPVKAEETKTKRSRKK